METKVRRKGILRWAGSKRGALPTLLGLVPQEFDRYVEPFAGSAVMHFALGPKSAFISDLNKPLANFYAWLKRDPDGLYELASQWDRTKETYLENRASFDTEGCGLIDAAVFYYLNNNCFNGIYRTNKSNKFNVPFGGQRMPKMPSLLEVRYFSAKLNGADFRCLDFREAIGMNLEPGTFFYIDPPYFVDDRRVFREYGPEYFSKRDLQDLSNLLHEIHAVGAKFMLSYADCELARSVFKGWQSDHIKLTRNVGGFKKSRRQDSELVLRNYIH